MKLINAKIASKQINDSFLKKLIHLVNETMDGK
jgi:hypothetical protein